MRDSKILFLDNAAGNAGSAVVDAGSTRPGIGRKCFLTVTASAGSTISAVVLQDAAEATGAFADKASYAIPAEVAAKGGVILTGELPEHALRFLKITLIGGAAGDTVTAGLDFGLQAGTEPTQPYLV